MSEAYNIELTIEIIKKNHHVDGNCWLVKDKNLDQRRLIVIDAKSIKMN